MKIDSTQPMGEAPLADEAASSEDVGRRILAAATQLVADGGPNAATTRAVAAAAGVQPPTIYRIFGDKRGLLDAVAEHGLASHVVEKAKRAPHADPVHDLRDGWDMHVNFGLTHPGLFAIMTSSPHSGGASPAFARGMEILQRRIRRIAAAGRLSISEARAVALVQAAGVGTVLTLLSQPSDARDMALSDVAREAVITAITGEPDARASGGPRGAAASLRASLDHTPMLTNGERHLLGELLDRIANGE